MPINDSGGHLYAIGKAVKAYRIKHNALPPAYLADKQGKPLLSWRVAILPYMGQEALYKRFHLDEPWDSAHNRSLVAHMPEVYREPAPCCALDRRQGFDPFGPPSAAKKTTASDAAGKTQFLLLRGPKTFYADVSPPMPRNYEDWTKAIVVVVRPDRSVPWTKPEEFTFDAKDPAAGLMDSGGDTTLIAGGVATGFALPNFGDKSETARIRNIELRRSFTGEEPPEPTNLPPPGFIAPTPGKYTDH